MGAVPEVGAWAGFGAKTPTARRIVVGSSQPKTLKGHYPRGQGHACSTYFCQALAQLVLEHSAVLEEGSERLSTRQAQESRFAEEES